MDVTKPLRQNLNEAGIEYYGDMPANTKVYLEKPQIVHPLTNGANLPKTATNCWNQPTKSANCAKKTGLEWQTLRLRANERGYLEANLRVCVFGLFMVKKPRQEWLLFRQDAVQITYVLSNAPETIDLKTMAWRKTHRYLIERSNEDAKDEFGWDEFQTRKYRAWKHQLALTILASWFVAETRLDWQKRFEQSPDLLVQYEVDALPKLSVANVRELLRASMPLPQLSPDEAAQSGREPSCQQNSFSQITLAHKAALNKVRTYG